MKGLKGFFGAEITLSDHQKEIYDNNQKILELQKKNAEYQKEAKKEQDPSKAQKILAAIIENAKERAAIDSINLKTTNEMAARRKVLNTILQTPRSDRSKTNDARAEIEEHSKLVQEHANEIKRGLAEQKKEQQQTYTKEKNQLFNAAGNFISDPAALNKILTPLAEKKGTKESAGLGDMFSAGMSAIAFAADNAGSVINIVGSVDFYKAEAAKIPRGKENKEEMSFFLKLLEDQDTEKFLSNNSAKLGNLVEAIAPNIISIGIRELSKLPELQEQMKNDLKEHGTLDKLKNDLAKLEAKPKLTEADNKQIEELKDQISNRKVLELRIGVAETVGALDKAGINTAYIVQKILPVAINPIKEVLKNPKDIIDVANAAVDIVTQDDKKKTQESLSLIASKVDAGKLIGSSGVKDFLVNESGNLAKIATVVMQTNSDVKAQADKFGITPEIAQKAIPVFTNVAAEALKDSNKLTEVYKEVVNVASKLTDITAQEKAEKEAQKDIDRSKLSEDKIKALDEKKERLKTQKNAALSEMIGAASKVALEDKLLDSVRTKVPVLLDQDRKAVVGVVAHNLTRLEQETKKRTEAIEASGADVKALKKPSIIGQVIAGTTPEFTQKTADVAIGLASTVLKETSNKQIQGLVQSGQEFLTAPKEEKSQVIMKIAQQGVAIISNENITKSVVKVGEVLTTEKEQVKQIVSNTLKTEPVKKQLDKFGVAPELVQNTVSMATEVGAALLTEDNLKKIPKVYNAYTNFANSEKDQKNVALSGLIGAATDIALQDSVLSSARTNVAGLLNNNQVAINEAVTHNVGRLKEDSLPRQALEGIDLQNTTKAVTGLVSTVLKETSNEQIRGLASSGQEFLTAPKEEKSQVIMKIAQQGIAIINNDNVVTSIANVGKLLTTEQVQVQGVVDNVLKTEPVKKQLDKFGVAPELVQNTVSMATEVGAALLTEDNLKKIPAVYNAYTNFANSEKDQKNAALSDLISAASKVALEDKLLDSIRTTIPALLDQKQNQADVAKSVVHNLTELEKETKKRIEARAQPGADLTALKKPNIIGQVIADASPEFTQKVTSAVIDLASTVLKETSNDQIKGLVTSGQRFLTEPKENRLQVVQELVGKSATILGNPEIAKSLDAVGTTLVNSNTDISKIANNAMAAAELGKFGITEKQVQDTVPIVTKAVAAVLSSAQDVANIATKTEVLLANLDKKTTGLNKDQRDAVGAIIDSLNTIVKQPGISETLKTDLPDFLIKNKDAIVGTKEVPGIASNIVKNTPALAKLTGEMKISDELVRDTAELGTNLLISVAPMVDRLAKATLQDKDQLVTIISDVRDLTKADLKTDNGKEVLNKVVSNVIALKNNNPELKSIFDNELPGLLEKNQAQLAKVIDGVIATKAGPGLKLETEKIISIVAKNLPAVSEIADLYSKGSYAAMFPKVVKLAFQKDVLSTAISTYSTMKKYKEESKKEVKKAEVPEKGKQKAEKNVRFGLPSNGKKAELEGQARDIAQAQGLDKFKSKSRPQRNVISKDKQQSQSQGQARC